MQINPLEDQMSNNAAIGNNNLQPLPPQPQIDQSRIIKDISEAL